jgi:hypothetical protein
MYRNNDRTVQKVRGVIGYRGSFAAQRVTLRSSRVGPTRRRALLGRLWPYVGWIGFHAAAPCSLLNDGHPRPVNADGGPTLLMLWSEFRGALPWAAQGHRSSAQPIPGRWRQ